MIAIDESKGSLKAVEHAGRQYAGTTDLHITLFHVLPNLATTFWDDDHVLTKREMADRKKVIDKWFQNGDWSIFSLVVSRKRSVERHPVQFSSLKKNRGKVHIEMIDLR